MSTQGAIRASCSRSRGPEPGGGGARDGTRRILELQPTELHERTPLFIGSRREVEEACEVLACRAEPTYAAPAPALSATA